MPRRIRWGLKSLLAVVTIAALFLAVRVNERSNIIRVIQEVEANDGYVLFQWESPVIDDRSFQYKMPAQLQFQDQTGQSTTIQTAPRTFDIVVTDFSFKSDIRPVASFMDFISGTHADIDIHTVVVEVDLIEDDLINALTRLKRLQSVRWVSNVLVSSEKEREAKVLRLEKALPNIDIKYAANYKLDDR